MSTNSRRQEIQEALEKINVSQRDSEVFFALLEYGISTAAEIGKRLPSIPRTSIYDIIKTLQQQGLVSTFAKGKQTYFQVENIEHTVDILEAQKREITEKQNTIRSIADLFAQMKTGTTYQPATRFFEGKSGILAIHREIQNARLETRTLVDISSVYRVFPRIVSEDNLKDFQTFQVPKKDLMVKSREAERYLKVAPISEFHQVKWLPLNVHFKTDTLIWGGHVAIIDYKDHLSGIIMDNPTIADTFVAWFEMMWGNTTLERDTSV